MLPWPHLLREAAQPFPVRCAMQSRLALCMEALLEVEQRLTALYETADSATENFQIAEAASFVRAALKSITDTPMALSEELTKGKSAID